MSDVISPMAANTVTRRDLGETQAHDRPTQVDQVMRQTEQAAEGTAVASPENLEAAVASLQQVIESASQRRLQFDVHDETDDLFVQVTDRATGVVIRTIPSVEVLDLHARLADAVGALLDTEA